MGRRNFLIEGVSCTGKTSVCKELQHRGYHAINGDRELAYQGDPGTGAPTDTRSHDHHLWRIATVKALIDDHRQPMTFLCGGSRNFDAFLDLFDGVFVLTVDEHTLRQRLAQRPADEFGATPAERDLVLRLHRTGEDTPDGVRLHASQPLADVVDDILRRVGADTHR